MNADSFPFRFFVIICLLFPLPGVSDAGIPEPETVIWGKVFNTIQGNRIEMTDGNVEWTIRAKDGEQKSYEFATEVECLRCTAYEDGECVDCNVHAYMIKVPHEAVITAEGMDMGDDAVPLPEAYQQYDHIEAKVNGITARIIPKSPDWQYILAGQPRRCASYEADLEFVNVLSDSDGDGMPDWWEEKYGLNKLMNDADEDSDGDGWINLAEFENSTNPFRSNTAPSLLDATLTIYEGGFTQFRPEITDSDTPPENIQIRFPEIPDGIRLLFNGRPLAPEGTVTLTELEAGKVVLEHTAPGGDDLRITMQFGDGESMDVPATLNLEIFRPSLGNGTDALYWADAYYHSEQLKKGVASPNLLSDRSGNGNIAKFYDSVSGVITAAEIVTDEVAPSGRPTIALDGTGWLELPEPAFAFPGGNVTLFSVFRSVGNNDQIIASGPFFEIGIAGSAHPSHRGEIRVATENAAVYGNRRVKNEWLISAVRRNDGETQIDLNGLWTGGPFVHEEETRLGTDMAVGAKKERRWNFADEQWEFEFEQVFDGHLAEILVFDKELPETRKWQVYAYLFSKWHGWRVGDFSDTSRSVSLKGVSGAAKMEDYHGFSYSDFTRTSGTDHSYIFLGSQGDDNLIGGYENDILIGGPGADEFTGFRGADIFVVDDRDIVWDFSADEGDILHLGHLTEDTGKSPDAYLRFEIQHQVANLESFTIMRIDSDGDGSGYDDAAVTLRSVVLRNADLNRMWADGHLHTGSIDPSLVIATEEDASPDFSDSRHYHRADYAPTDYNITLSELLRMIQLYNKIGYHCDANGEDGYGAGYGHAECKPHSADYNPTNWRIDLTELLRVIQIYNSSGYHEDTSGEDGFGLGKR